MRGSAKTVEPAADPMNLTDALKREWPAHRGAVQTALVASLTLGLAPFVPHPHVYKQLVALFEGTLQAPIDVFDLFLHGAPWAALLYFAGRLFYSALRSR